MTRVRCFVHALAGRAGNNAVEVKAPEPGVTGDALAADNEASRRGSALQP